MESSTLRYSVFVAAAAACVGGFCLADEPTLLIGEWAVVKMEARGKEQSESNFEGMRWTFANETLEVRPGRSTPAGIAGKPPLKCSYKLDDTKTPHYFNWTLGAGDNRREIKAIYQLHENVLKVSFGRGGQERPTTFDTKGTENVVYTFNRVKVD